MWSLEENSTSSLGRFVASCQPRKACSIIKTISIAPGSLVELDFAFYVKGWIENVTKRDTNPHLNLYVMAAKAAVNGSTADTADLSTASRLKVFDLDSVMQAASNSLTPAWRSSRLVLRAKKAVGGVHLRLLFEGGNGRRSSGPSGRNIAVDNIKLRWRNLPEVDPIAAAADGQKQQ